MSKGSEPAFPGLMRQVGENTYQVLSQGGLTKREYFAAMAMQGMLASEGSEAGKAGAIAHLRARCAIDHADALLAELDKGER